MNVTLRKGVNRELFGRSAHQKDKPGDLRVREQADVCFFYTVLPKQTSAHIFAKGKTGLNLPLQFFVSLEGAVQS